MSKRNTLYLIDGSSYIFRAFFGVRQQLATSKGFPTNALYGFINMLQKVIREEKPDYLVVASGHFSVPYIPEYEGMKSFPGRILHSHDFRDAEEFRG